MFIYILNVGLVPQIPILCYFLPLKNNKIIHKFYLSHLFSYYSVGNVVENRNKGGVSFRL